MRYCYFAPPGQFGNSGQSSHIYHQISDIAELWLKLGYVMHQTPVRGAQTKTQREISVKQNN